MKKIEESNPYIKIIYNKELQNESASNFNVQKAQNNPNVFALQHSHKTFIKYINYAIADMYDLYDPLKLSILTLLSIEKIHITNFVQFHEMIKDLLEFQKTF